MAEEGTREVSTLALAPSVAVAVTMASDAGRGPKRALLPFMPSCTRFLFDASGRNSSMVVTISERLLAIAQRRSSVTRQPRSAGPT